MDLLTEFERTINQMTWEEVLQTTFSVAQDSLTNSTVQPLMAYPFSQAEFYSGPVAAAVTGPPDPYSNNLVFQLPEGIWNGEVLYSLATVKPNMIKHKRQERQLNLNQPYIKKPLNAFMLFRKEQRPHVMAELNITESTQVNVVLGQRWKSLSKGEQARYYVEAERERQLHAQRYPWWSNRDNYGKKMRRIRKKTLTTAENVAAFASQYEEVTQQFVSPVQIHWMKPSLDGASQSGAMEAAHKETGVIEPPTTQTAPMNPPYLKSPLSDPSELWLVSEVLSTM